MSDNNILVLPDLLLLTDYDGDINSFIEAAYEVFKRDFVDVKPTFRGVRLGLKKIPVTDGKEVTFWHMTSEGEDETNRRTDIKRLERIRWPAPIIKNSEHPCLKVWENTRGNKSNILIFYEDEGYLVVLRKGNGYILPWTAYLVEERYRRKKLLREWNSYKMQNPPNM